MYFEKTFRLNACAFTGHRPSKLPWKQNEDATDCLAVKEIIESQIVALVDSGVTSYYSGMAEGTDMICAEIVLKLRETFPAMKLHCAIPYILQAEKWKPPAQKRYYSILEQADSIIRVNREYKKDCFLERNRYMIDHSAVLIAIYNGERRGGTAMTVHYARKNGREIFIIDPISRKIVSEPANRLLW